MPRLHATRSNRRIGSTHKKGKRSCNRSTRNRRRATPAGECVRARRLYGGARSAAVKARHQRAPPRPSTQTRPQRPSANPSNSMHQAAVNPAHTIQFRVKTPHGPHLAHIETKSNDEPPMPGTPFQKRSPLISTAQVSAINRTTWPLPPHWTDPVLDEPLRLPFNRAVPIWE